MVYPRIPETFWSYTYSLPFVGKRATMPPLGLLTVAAIAGDQLECRLVDMNIEKLTDRDLRWADLVMVSAMIVQADSFAHVVARCNDQGIPVAAGGPYPTSCHEEISGVDYFVLGEAELTLPPFLKDLREGRPQPLYTSESWADMTTTPVPRFDLCNLDAYNSLPSSFPAGVPSTVSSVISSTFSATAAGPRRPRISSVSYKRRTISVSKVISLSSMITSSGIVDAWKSSCARYTTGRLNTITRSSSLPRPVSTLPVMMR
jgi:radical SAM superfamily enzyme YgiQ (UPF0313 family)